MTLSDLSSQQQRALLSTSFFGSLSLLRAYWSLLCGREFTLHEAHTLLYEVIAAQRADDADPPDPCTYATIVHRS